ncbi:MAG: DEAD/DEAH box helicase, partial [Candidatus Magasanikbacteria bacterium]|nr:DEAD/DEAH box helicase [Candidatus Magasanikbacteria bacterium]
MYLPITEFRQQIVDTIKANRVVILTSPTGSGKTTQVPQYLLEEGYSSILTQPRRLAARAVAQRMAKETGTKLGELIGLNTRYEKHYSALTRCLVSTDGLVVIRELLGHNTCDVLILDEVHEGGLHTEVLMALAKRALDRYADLKLVIMSATIDAPALSTYFDDAPIIALKGRSYKIRSKRPGASVEADAIDCLKMGKDVLVFQPGLSEIFSTLGKIDEVLGDSVYCMPLHAQLSISEQERCFATYDRPKCI